MSLILQNKFHQFSNNSIANHEIFNESLLSLIQDLNTLLQDTESINEQVERYLVLFDLETVEQLKHKLNQLIKRYNAYTALYNKNNYSAVISLDFYSESDRLLYLDPLSELLYSDPKLPNLKYSSNNFLYINNKGGGLQFPMANQSVIPFDNISLIHPINLGSYKNFYYAKDNPGPVTLHIQLDYRKEVQLSYLSFIPSAFYPFNIKNIYYLNSGIWTVLPNTSLNAVFVDTEIDFGPITTTGIKIEVELVSCKASNRSVKYSFDEFTRQLLIEKNMYYSLDDYTGDPEMYNTFAFHFGLSSIETGYRERKAYGIFVGKPVKLTEPAHFHLETTEINNLGDVSSEYYIYKKDYDDKGFVIHSAIIPILPKDVDTIDEVVVPLNNKAKLSFYPKDDLITVRRNGIIVPPQDYIYDPETNTITFNVPYLILPGQGAIFSVEYTPYHTQEEYPVPVFNTYNTYNKTAILNAEDGELLQNSRIKFVLPYIFKPGSVSVAKYMNGELDNSAPNLNTNLTLSGRILTIDFDLTAYPKLLGTDFHITGELLDGSLVEEQMYYFAPDNSLIINWNAFSQFANYESSEIYIVIVLRRKRETYTPDEFTIKNVMLYSNNFNDLLLSIDNLKGIE